MEKVACKSHLMAQKCFCTYCLKLEANLKARSLPVSQTEFEELQRWRNNINVLSICEEEEKPGEINTCLKFSLRKPYMTGLVQTEVIARRWQEA